MTKLTHYPGDPTIVPAFFRFQGPAPRYAVDRVPAEEIFNELDRRPRGTFFMLEWSTGQISYARSCYDGEDRVTRIECGNASPFTVAER